MTETSSFSCYALGSNDVLDDISCYLYGEADILDNINAYTIGKIKSSTTAFVAAQILSRAAQSAFIPGLVNHVDNSKFCYCAGISRSSLSACIGGAITMAVDYIWLKTNDESLEKKFRVLEQDYDDGTLEKSEEVNKTIGGGIDHSIGAVYKTWSPIIRVRHTEPEADYGNMADLEYFFSLNNPNGTPNNDITFIDHHQIEYTVHIVGPLTKSKMGFEIEGECAWFLYRLQFMRVQ